MIKRDIERLVREELDKIADAKVRDAISKLLISPRCEEREWDYGEPGQTYSCWIVLEHPQSNTAICYCAEGFGPVHPWGLLWLSENLSMGMDSSWFAFLEDAFRGSQAWDGENPPGYEIA